MPEIRFDGRAIEVAKGTNLVEAGGAAGVPVPVFCYQRDLGAVGACRVCAVTATIQGRSRLVMACMTAAEDGMEVTTLDPGSVSFRRHVLEWLMLNHPHDCPVCDEGGECQLQDLTIASGHAQRSFSGGKRTFRNQYLGEFIVHEMNRCITCYRCSRFYQEYAGGRDFEVAGSRDRVYFGRFEDGPLESPYSGNLVEMCPTGVFTDQLFRYRSRVWDLEQAPSICPHCSVGCNVLPGARYRELQRVRARDNPEVNGVFLCDRGQFGHGWVMDPRRPGRPVVDGAEMEWGEALGTLGARLIAIAREHGSPSVALISSPRASVETHGSLAALATGSLEGASVSCFDDPAREAGALAALELLRATGAAPLDQGELGRCDVLLVAGASLVDEAPLASLAARQVGRHGRLFVIGAVERHLGDVAERIVPVHPARLGGVLDEVRASLNRARTSGADPARPSQEDGPPEGGSLARVASALLEAERPGILVGSELVDGAACTAAAALARALLDLGRPLRLGACFPGPNGFGAALNARAPALPGLLERFEAGAIRAALLVECDLDDFGARVSAALRRLDLLVIADHAVHELASRAHAVLPTLASYECDGTFVNRAGRMQGFRGVRTPGVPVTARIIGEAFPRDPRHVPPGADARPAWWVLEELRAWTPGDRPPRDLESLRLAIANGPFARLVEAIPGAAGAQVDLAAAPARPGHRVPGFTEPGAGLSLFRLERTLGSETLSRRSEPMRRMAGPPVASVAADDDHPAGSSTRLAVELGADAVLELEARHDASVPPGVLLVPRDLAMPSLPQGQAVRVRERKEVRT